MPIKIERLDYSEFSPHKWKRISIIIGCDTCNMSVGIEKDVPDEVWGDRQAELKIQQDAWEELKKFGTGEGWRMPEVVGDRCQCDKHKFWSIAQRFEDNILAK